MAQFSRFSVAKESASRGDREQRGVLGQGCGSTRVEAGQAGAKRGPADGATTTTHSQHAAIGAVQGRACASKQRLHSRRVLFARFF